MIEQGNYKHSYSIVPLNIASSHMLLFQFPIGRPECGWKGEFCQSDTEIGGNTTAGITSIFALFFIITLSTLAAFRRYRYTCVSNLRQVDHNS